MANSSDSDTSTHGIEVKKRKSPNKGTKVDEPILQFSDNELNYNTLLPFAHHKLGLETFSRNVVKYKSESPLDHFCEALENVIDDSTLDPPQKDPIEIIKAWRAWLDIKPRVFSDRLDLSSNEVKAKDHVDKKFITYMATLRSTFVVPIPVRVFCHMVCKDGCPEDFKGFNDRNFQRSNMDHLIRLLIGVLTPAESWNNVHNASMHMMLRWTDAELKELICPTKSLEEFNSLTPKEIGRCLDKWFSSLDNSDLDDQSAILNSLIPLAGQHRAGAIPRWKDKQPLHVWQVSVFKTVHP